MQSQITATLNANTQYFIVVWLFGTDPPLPGESIVQVGVTQNIVPANDTCAGAISVSLDSPINGTTVAANNDYTLSGSTCFTGVAQTPSTSPGRDVVYSFTAPAADNYSFRVTGYCSSQNLVVYVTSSCPAAPSVLDCSSTTTVLGAANRGSFSTAEEVICLALGAGQQVFIIVDDNTFAGGSAFTLEVNRCVRELEPNDTTGTANLFSPICGVEGSISVAGDVDFFSLGAPTAGTRVFALADGVAGSPLTLDFDMRVTTTTDTLEYDDQNNDAPFGLGAPNVGGTPLPGGNAFLRLNLKSAISVAEPYRLYAVLQPGGGGPGNTSAITEVEPNNTLAQANGAPNNYFYGTLPGPAPSSDVDVYRFNATAGDLVFLGLDGDPLRDNTPIDADLALLDSSGSILISVNDPGSTSSITSGAGNLAATMPFSPAEGLVYRVKTSGNYYARVRIGTVATGSTGAGDYLLSISLNCLPGGGPTAVKLSGFSAISFENGVLLQWRTGHEADNLGFNVYREEGGKRTRINAEILAGSALVAGPGTSLSAGQSYFWADEGHHVNGRTSYWLEDIDLKGERNWHGPIKPQASPLGTSLPRSRALLLSSLGRQEVSAERATNPVGQAAEISRVNSSKITAQSIGQRDLAGQRAVKIRVKREGWYRVEQPDLLTAGLDPNLNPRNLQLFVDGRELPIIVEGEQDKRFDPSDAVEFYGVGLDTASTDTRTYWLVVGTQPGQRIHTVQSQGVAGAPGSFPYTVERKDRIIYFSALRNGEKENFFGSLVGLNPVDQTLFVQHMSQPGEGQTPLTVALQGVTLTSHKVKLLLNGTEIGALNFDGQAEGIANLQISNQIVREGNNVITLIPQGGPSDISLVDYVRLTYPHSYLADNNALRFAAAPGQQVTISGFTNPAVRAIDITDPDAVQGVSVVVRPQSGTYSGTITISGARPRMLFMFADQALKPDALVANQPSNWRDFSHQADLVIITQRDFRESMNPLKELRQSQGFAVAVIDIEDLYDEFSYGNRTPWAVRDFLAWSAMNWQRSPRFVLLAGDASYDSRNYLGHGDFDLVPSKLIDTEFMEAASDDWFADLNGDGLSDIIIGRLPARTAQEASRMIAKIVSYDSSPRVDSVLLVSDKNDGFDFEAASAQLRPFIPAGVTVEEIQRGRMDPATIKDRLLDAINRGQKIISYMGHGNADSWRNDLLTSADVSALRNENRLALFALMNCLNGYFQDPVSDSLAESLIKVDRRGAIAVWASSGLTMPTLQSVMSQQLFQLLFNRIASSAGPITVGEATRRAKASVSDMDVRRTWILFGDPTTRLH
jgi:hypothetical protein